LYIDDVRIADSSIIVKTQEPIVVKSFSKVYPNPTTCDLIIEIDKSKTKAIKLNLLNAQGQIVKTQNRQLWDTPQYHWALCDLPSGFYFYFGTLHTLFCAAHKRRARVVFLSG
jgi:Secretion system C-terminal sorting domain